MAAIQKEFAVFSEKYSLRKTFRLLNIVPADFQERQRRYRYLDHLKNYPSDVDGVNGHDRVVQVRRENLESDAPLPMYNRTHLASDDNRLTVARGRAVAHELQEYIIISTPTVPVDAAKRDARLAEQVRRIAESVQA